ncbi:deoxynucleoside kinase [bacterium]|nr:deoxynucleoside kinase [bacterium]
MTNTTNNIYEVQEDPDIKRYQVPHRLTNVVRRLMKRFSKKQELITCIGNIGAGKSSLIKVLAFNTGMNALFELPDDGFEDHFVQNDSFSPLLATMKDTAKRTLGRYYGGINEFIECQQKHPIESPTWMIAKKNLEKGALDIQHAYLDLRKMQLQTVQQLKSATCVDGSVLADRYAFCEVLHNDMDVPYLTREALNVIDERLEKEFRLLAKPNLMILLHSPLDYLLQNIRERSRIEEDESTGDDGIPEGLRRLITALNNRYDNFTNILREKGWYDGPVLKIDASKIDFISNVRHLIAVYEGIEKCLEGQN